MTSIGIVMLGLTTILAATGGYSLASAKGHYQAAARSLESCRSLLTAATRGREEATRLREQAEGLLAQAQGLIGPFTADSVQRALERLTTEQLEQLVGIVGYHLAQRAGSIVPATPEPPEVAP